LLRKLKADSMQQGPVVNRTKFFKLCMRCTPEYRTTWVPCPEPSAVSFERGPGGVMRAYHRDSCTATEEDALISRRFFAAILLWRMSYEDSLQKTADRFQLPLGALETLRKSAFMFAGTQVWICD
jgi:hypothetical protein